MGKPAYKGLIHQKSILAVGLWAPKPPVSQRTIRHKTQQTESHAQANIQKPINLFYLFSRKEDSSHQQSRQQQISVCGFWASLVFFWGQGSCSDTWQHYATVLISCSQLCQTLSWGLQRQWRAQLANISHPKAFSKVLVMFLGTVQWLNGALRAAWSLTTLSSEAAKCWGQIMMLSISAFPEQVVKIHSITPLTEASTAAGYKTA